MQLNMNFGHKGSPECSQRRPFVGVFPWAAVCTSIIFNTEENRKTLQFLNRNCIMISVPRKHGKLDATISQLLSKMLGIMENQHLHILY